jgi:hypothetical protein
MTACYLAIGTEITELPEWQCHGNNRPLILVMQGKLPVAGSARSVTGECDGLSFDFKHEKIECGNYAGIRTRVSCVFVSRWQTQAVAMSIPVSGGNSYLIIKMVLTDGYEEVSSPKTPVTMNSQAFPKGAVSVNTREMPSYVI